MLCYLRYRTTCFAYVQVHVSQITFIEVTYISGTRHVLENTRSTCWFKVVSCIFQNNNVIPISCLTNAIFECLSETTLVKFCHHQIFFLLKLSSTLQNIVMVLVWIINIIKRKGNHAIYQATIVANCLILQRVFIKIQLFYQKEICLKICLNKKKKDAIT